LNVNSSLIGSFKLSVRPEQVTPEKDLVNLCGQNYRGRLEWCSSIRTRELLLSVNIKMWADKFGAYLTHNFYFVLCDFTHIVGFDV